MHHLFSDWRTLISLSPPARLVYQVLHRSTVKMGIFRFENKYAAPSRQQRDHYMKGEAEEHHFGPEGAVTLILYKHAAYLKDDIDGTRILYTGDRDKSRSVEDAAAMVEYHLNRADSKESFHHGERD